MSEPSQELIRSELERLLSSDFLRRSPSHLRLLRYLVDKRLENDEGALREMSIGIEIFQRDPATYDPKTDPIVRVNVSRLRERLLKHYAMFDAPPQVRIELPKGRYVPEFVELGARELTAPRLLVLPFVSERNDDTLATLLFESAIGELQSILQVLVVGTRSARAVADGAPLDSARRVNAQAVLSSRLVRSGTNHPSAASLGVHTMLMSSPYGQLLGSKRYVQANDESEAVFVERVSREIREDSLRALVEVLPGEYTLPATRRGFRDVPDAATDAFVAARRASALGTADGHREARRLLEQAIELAPKFALAHAYLAAAMGNLSMYEQVTPEQAWRIGTEASKRALELDPNEASAYLNLAADKIYYEYDFRAASILLGQARKLAPRHPGVHMLLGTLASYSGDFDAALAHLDGAQEVDPLFPAIRANRAVALYFARRFEDATRTCVELLSEYPQRTSTRLTLVNSLVMMGHFADARRELETVIEHDPDDAGARLTLAIVYAREGDLRQARKITGAVRANTQIETTNPSALAGVHAQLGEQDEAIHWLEISATKHEGGFAEVQVDPMLAPLLARESFHRLLDRYAMRPMQLATQSRM